MVCVYVHVCGLATGLAFSMRAPNAFGAERAGGCHGLLFFFGISSFLLGFFSPIGGGSCFWGRFAALGCRVWICVSPLGWRVLGNEMSLWEVDW